MIESDLFRVSRETGTFRSTIVLSCYRYRVLCKAEVPVESEFAFTVSRGNHFTDARTKRIGLGANSDSAKDYAGSSRTRVSKFYHLAKANSEMVRFLRVCGLQTRRKRTVSEFAFVDSIHFPYCT